MLPLLFAAAALMSSPQFGSGDPFKGLWRGTGEEALFVTLFVAPDGKILDCEVYYSQAPKAQSAKFCNNAIGLKLSGPAIGPDGKPEYGILEFGRIVVSSTTPPDFEFPPDLVVNVNKLPHKLQKKQRTILTILVDDHGGIAACQPDKDALADYAKVACDQVRQLTTRVRMNPGSSAVRYVTSFVVDFVKDKATR